MNTAFEVEGIEALSNDEMTEVNGGFNFGSFFGNLFTNLPTLISNGRSSPSRRGYSERSARKTIVVPASANVIAAALPSTNPKTTTAGRMSLPAVQARDSVGFLRSADLIRPGKGRKLNQYVTRIATDSKEET
jgi:hypothetical protein